MQADCSGPVDDDGDLYAPAVVRLPGFPPDQDGRPAVLLGRLDDREGVQRRLRQWAEEAEPYHHEPVELTWEQVLEAAEAEPSRGRRPGSFLDPDVEPGSVTPGRTVARRYIAPLVFTVDPGAREEVDRVFRSDEAVRRQLLDELAGQVFTGGPRPHPLRHLFREERIGLPPFDPMRVVAWADGEHEPPPGEDVERLRPPMSHLFLPRVVVDEGLPDNVVELRGPGDQRVRAVNIGDDEGEE